MSHPFDKLRLMANGKCAHCDEPPYSTTGLCKTHMWEYQRRWQANHPERVREIQRRSYQKNRASILEKDRQGNWREKLAMVAAYGGACACCGESEPRFLSIDHVDGGGHQHRMALRRSGKSFSYAWLRSEGYPQDDYRLLCYNCNLSAGFYGTCPHAS